MFKSTIPTYPPLSSNWLCLIRWQLHFWEQMDQRRINTKWQRNYWNLSNRAEAMMQYSYRETLVPTECLKYLRHNKDQLKLILEALVNVVARDNKRENKWNKPSYFVAWLKSRYIQFLSFVMYLVSPIRFNFHSHENWKKL